MTTEAWEFIATCPTGHGYNNPQVVDTRVDPGVVERIRIRVPPGPSGDFGFALGQAGEQIIPAHGQQYIFADDETIELYPPRNLTSGAWQVIMVNFGTYLHSVYVTYFKNVEVGGTPAYARGALTLDDPAVY